VAKIWLSNYLRTKLIPDPEPTDIGWFGNLSTGHGIGIVIGMSWAQFLFIDKAKADPRCTDIAWLETVAVRLGTLVLLKMGLDSGTPEGRAHA
jgi:hypothetical protein